MKISVTDFSAPIGESVFKFCVHLQDGKVYCVNGNLDANPHFAFFFKFSFFPSFSLIYSNKKETSDFHDTVSFHPVKMS